VKPPAGFAVSWTTIARALTAATRPVRRLGAVHADKAWALSSTRSPRLRYAGIAAARLPEVVSRLKALRAPCASGINSRRAVSRIWRSNAKLRGSSVDARGVSGASDALDDTVERPLPATSSATVLAPTRDPCHGTMTYSSSVPADVMHAPSVMLTLIAWPTASVTGAE
jgi:hypothetical protein